MLELEYSYIYSFQWNYLQIVKTFQTLIDNRLLLVIKKRKKESLGCKDLAWTAAYSIQGSHHQRNMMRSKTWYFLGHQSNIMKQRIKQEVSRTPRIFILELPWEHRAWNWNFQYRWQFRKLSLDMSAAGYIESVHTVLQNQSALFSIIVILWRDF